MFSKHKYEEGLAYKTKTLTDNMKTDIHICVNMAFYSTLVILRFYDG